MKQLVKIIVFMTVCILGISVLPWAASVPVIRVDAKNKTGKDIGVELGRLIIDRFPDIAKSVDSYLESYSSQDRFNYIVRRRLDAVRSSVDRRYRDEVDGMASLLVSSDRNKIGDGVLSSDEFWFFQLIPDIGRESSCSGFGVFGECSASGGPIVGRNMDWFTTEALRGIQAITVYEYEKNVLVNIGFAGYAAVVTGFNNRGLFAAHLDSPMGLPYPDPPQRMHSAVFEIRKALETEGSISRAASLMRRQRYPFSHNVLLADTRDVQVLEQVRGEPGRLRSAYSPVRIDISWDKPCQIAVVNFFALRGYSNHVTETCRWRRFETLAVFDRYHKAYPGDVMKIMLDTKTVCYDSIFRDRTVQSMVFTPEDRKLYLYTVPVSGVHPPNPVMEEVKDLIPSAPPEGMADVGNLLMIFLLVIGVPVGAVIYYKWESSLKRRLSVYGDEKENEENDHI